MSRQKQLPTTEIQITDLNPDGNGVGRLESGMVAFVPLTAPGDRARIALLRETKTYAVGRVETLLTPSPLRQDPACPVYRRCGGCVYRHITPEAEEALKRQTVQQAFRRIGHLEVLVQPTRSFGWTSYRNKVVYPLTAGCPDQIGYFARRTHEVIPHTDCPLQDPLFTELAMFHVKHAARLGVPLWDERTGHGVLRHLAMRRNRAGRYIVCMVASAPFPQATAMAQALCEAFPQVVGVSLNCNPTPGNTIFGPQTQSLQGDSTLRDTLCGKEFTLSPTSFYQVNADCAEAMYRHAAELVQLRDDGILLDLYCGAGTIGLSMIRDGQNLCGVEILPEAVENAKHNARQNGRSEADTLFVCGDASVGVQACRDRFGEPNVIVVDPPRKGLSPEVISTLLSVSPPRILYISCNPATLAADCQSLCTAGYTITSATPYNMFPRTGHVECVTLLERTHA